MRVGGCGGAILGVRLPGMGSEPDWTTTGFSPRESPSAPERALERSRWLGFSGSESGDEPGAENPLAGICAGAGSQEPDSIAVPASKKSMLKLTRGNVYLHR